MGNHKVGDILLAENIDGFVLGFIKVIQAGSNGCATRYQIEWANDLYCGSWYFEDAIDCFKDTLEDYWEENYES